MSFDPALIGLRRSTFDHPLGTIKAWLEATHFRMQRLIHVHIEMAFHVLANNLKRTINSIGIRGLLAAIPA